MGKLINLKFTDGAMFRGDTALEVVEKMKNRSYFTSGKTVEEYMRGYANRLIRLFDDHSIDYSTPELFVASLMLTSEISHSLSDPKEKKQ